MLFETRFEFLFIISLIKNIKKIFSVLFRNTRKFSTEHKTRTWLHNLSYTVKYLKLIADSILNFIVRAFTYESHRFMINLFVQIGVMYSRFSAGLGALP